MAIIRIAGVGSINATQFTVSSFLPIWAQARRGNELILFTNEGGEVVATINPDHIACVVPNEGDIH